MIDPEAKQQLVEHWLPHVRQLKAQRRPMFWLMAALIVFLFLFACYLLYLSSSTNEPAGLLRPTAVLGACSLAVVYLGKLQSCNDSLLALEATVYLGDREQLLKAMDNLACLGQMRGLLEDAKKYVG